MIQNYKFSEKWPQKGQLQFLYLNISNVCNLRCFYCYDEEYISTTAKEEHITLSEIELIAEDCVELGLPAIAITGGEPLLNKNWFEIGKIFSDADILVSYSTNGTLLNKVEIEKLGKINASLQISLDGNDEIMEFISKGKKIYTRTLANLKVLQSQGVDVLLNCVVGKHNFSFLDEFIHELDQRKLRCRFVPFHAELNSKHSEYMLSVQEKYDLIMKINQHNKRTGSRNCSMTLPFLMNPEYITPSFQPGCGWAYNIAGILPSGDVTVCAPAAGIDFFVAGNVKKTSFKEIWKNSDVFKNLRSYEANDLTGVCEMCPVKDKCVGSCRVAAYLKNGDTKSAGTMCQEFYDAVMNGEIDTDEFPVGCVKIKKEVA
ncbi:MAG: radical SAM protein [Oscillospiraceae bacterium]|nr:radical SAM protein [Oscillospiraceae bacterium]MCL2279802.1 radical SAM protein [Oscillospiraceae bacterium]